jgi:hypothetical protein
MHEGISQAPSLESLNVRNRKKRKRADVDSPFGALEAGEDLQGSEGSQIFVNKA